MFSLVSAEVLNGIRQGKISKSEANSHHLNPSRGSSHIIEPVTNVQAGVGISHYRDHLHHHWTLWRD